MTSVFGFPYPWSQRDAQQLHMTLVELYPSGTRALWAAQRADIQPWAINAEQAPAYVWKEILDEAGSSGMTEGLVQTVYELQKPTSPSRSFLESLLNDTEVELDTEPRSEDGAPNFLMGDDEIMEPEALLFRDDLTIQVGLVPKLVQTLQRVGELAPSVCKLSVSVHGATGSGTGFRIGPDLLLTNWHVLHDPYSEPVAQATAVTAEFRYEDDGAGGVKATVPIPCDVGTIVSSREDDWAVIKTKEPLSDEWPIIKLSEAKDPEQGDQAYIIQHPGGNRKRVGFVRNQVSSFNDQVVQYLTDTQAGSSGSPVFDATGELIALHHAGGRPQQVAGKQPISKNEGIRISRVKEGLNSKGIAFP